LMSRFHTGLEIERMDIRAITSLMASIGLKRGDFTALVDAIPPTVLQSAQAA
jgi:hypothetical protein